MDLSSLLNGGVIGSLITVCIKNYIDHRKEEKNRLDNIKKQRLHKTYSPLYLYSSLNLELADDILEWLKDIKNNLQNPDVNKVDSSSTKIKLILYNQEKLRFYNDKLISLMGETFGYIHADDELSIIQYLILSEKILGKDWPKDLTLTKVDATLTCFKGLCFLLNIIKSRTHHSTCEIKEDLDLVSLESALERLAPTITEYKKRETNYHF